MGRLSYESIELSKSLIGKTKEEALILATDKKYKIRVVREDTNTYLITSDLSFSRINLEIDNGIITKTEIY